LGEESTIALSWKKKVERDALGEERGGPAREGKTKKKRQAS